MALANSIVLPSFRPLTTRSISFGMYTYEKSARNSFEMHTCRAKDLKSRAMNTYEKHPGGAHLQRCFRTAYGVIAARFPHSHPHSTLTPKP